MTCITVGACKRRKWMKSIKRLRWVAFHCFLIGIAGSVFLFMNTPLWGADSSTALSLWQGKVKTELADFIFDVSTKESPDFIPPSKRVAVFDMDGTLLSEKPNYFVFDVAISYLNAHAHEIAEKGSVYKALCDAAKTHDYKYFISHVPEAFALPFEGKTCTFYRKYCRHVFETEMNAVKNRPHKTLVFKPMIQLIDLLWDRGFTVYVVSGSLQFCIMAISEQHLHVPQSHCIGSRVVVRPEKKGETLVFKRGKLRPPSNVKAAKAMRIMTRTGQAPVLAMGNSSGDIWMLAFTETSPYRTFTAIVDHDDPREFVYHDEKLLELARKEKWAVISMKNNFKTIYGDSGIKKK